MHKNNEKNLDNRYFWAKNCAEWKFVRILKHINSYRYFRAELISLLEKMDFACLINDTSAFKLEK